MRRTYLIDSENINDVWVELLQVLEDRDEILVFYTDKKHGKKSSSGKIHK